jgi:hypothetical protein
MGRPQQLQQSQNESKRLSKHITSQNPKLNSEYRKQVNKGVVLKAGSNEVPEPSLSESGWGASARYFGGMIGIVDREVRFFS